MMRTLTSLLVGLLFVFCSGCGKKKGLLGEWKVDKDFTLSQLGGEERLLGVLLSMMEGGTLTFLDDEYRFLAADGSGQSLAYELIEKPASDSWRIQLEDGSIQTWSREGERLTTNTYGGVVVKIYFERVDR